MSSFLQGTFVQATVLVVLAGTSQHSEWAYNALRGYYEEQKKLKLMAGTHDEKIVGSHGEVVYVTPETLAGTLLSGKIDPAIFLGVSNIDEREENVPTHYTVFSVQGQVNESGQLKRFFLPVAVQDFTEVLAKGSQGNVMYAKIGNAYEPMKKGWALAELRR